MIGKVLVLSFEIIGIAIGSFILGVIILGVLIFADRGEENEQEEKWWRLDKTSVVQKIQ